MGGNGPAPKLNRQRRQSPVRGDWVQLKPLAGPVLPILDDIPSPGSCEGEWPYTSRMYWDAWRESPVTATWTADDKALAIDPISAHAEAASGGRGAPPAEIRLRMESLGLTPKGRRDSRLLLPDETPADLGVVDSDTPSAPTPIRTLPEAI